MTMLISFQLVTQYKYGTPYREPPPSPAQCCPAWPPSSTSLPSLTSLASRLDAVGFQVEAQPLEMQDSETFVRTVYAGNAIMTLKSLDPVKV